MPEVAKVLPFRGRVAAAPCSREDAAARARTFLGREVSDRSAQDAEQTYADGDVLTSMCSQLWELINTSPADVAEESPRIYKWLSAKTAKDFFFDERDFFLGEAALLSAGSFRLLGKREETERWLDRADASFRHTVAPAAHLARVSYIRLTLRYDMRRHEEVLELVPSVALTFQKLGMESDLAKCRFLEAMSLKELGRFEEAAAGFERLVSGEAGRVEPALCGMALVNLGDLQSGQSAFDAALTSYAQAAPLLEAGNRFSALADLKLMVAVTLRKTGHLAKSLDTYRNAISDYVDLEMSTRAAYVRILLAEALLEAGKAREAEWQILAAVPTIDQEKMVPEGFVAMELLRGSVQQRNADPRALLELREYLQANN
jgi:tetratricopeptide (TPR) repeat protein